MFASFLVGQHEGRVALQREHQWSEHQTPVAIGGVIGGAIGIVLALPVTAILRPLVVYILRRLDHIRPEAASAGLLPGSPEKTQAEAAGTPVAT